MAHALPRPDIAAAAAAAAALLIRTVLPYSRL